MTYKVEKNVPLTNPRAEHRSYIGTLESMEIGDSFFVPAEHESDSKRVSVSCHIAAKRLGIKVSTRKLENGSRVWRIA